MDAFVAKKTLITTEAPHLDTMSIITKLDDVAKTDHLDVSRILAEKFKDPVLGTVRSWLQEGTSV